MRRSSTTRSPPATVLRRLQGEKLLQTRAETSNPSNPPTIRMIPTVLRLNPLEEFTSTAKVRMAPTTNKNRLKPIPTWYLLDDAWVWSGAHRHTATMSKERRQEGNRYKIPYKPDKRRRLASP